MNEDELKEEAKRCDNCICWNHHCNAECCRVFKIDKKLLRRYSDRILRLTATPPKDLINYYELHGMKNYFFNEDNYDKIEEKEDGYVYFHRDCDALEGNLCKLHGKPEQPQVCKDFNENKIINSNRWFVTPNCLARYK